MPKGTEQAKPDNSQALLSKLKSYYSALPTLPTFTIPKALSKLSAPELPALESLPELLPSYIAKKFGINNHNVVMSTLKGYHADMVKFANIVFGGSEYYCSNKTMVLIGDLAASVYPCSEKKAENDADALTEFVKTQTPQLVALKIELEKPITDSQGEESSKETDESSESNFQSDACDVSDADINEESIEIPIDDEKKKLCAALVQSIAGLSALYHQAKIFHEFCANYRNNPAMMRAALDKSYHLCREKMNELQLFLPAIYKDYDFDDVPDLEQIAADLPDTLDALLKNAPKGYAPSERVKVRVALGR